MELDFPGVEATCSDQALILHSEQGLETLASSVLGGGFGQVHWILNRHVHKNYDHPDPTSDLRRFARKHGIEEPFIGLLTAVYLRKARSETMRRGASTVTAVITAGVSNATAAGLSTPAELRPGTINLILLVDGNLAPAAMVNGIITATEAKTHLLLSRGTLAADGYPATGTSTDAVVIACTGRGDWLPYAGPATTVGWLIGQSVRQALEASLEAE